MYSDMDDRALPQPGSPIQKSPGLSLVSGLPKLIAATHVFHRFLMPRHPPFALSSLTLLRKNIHYSQFNPYSIVKELPSFCDGA